MSFSQKMFTGFGMFMIVVGLLDYRSPVSAAELHIMAISIVGMGFILATREIGRN